VRHGCGDAAEIHRRPAGTRGRGAWTGELRTLEVLADGPALAGLRLPVDQLLGTCAHVTATDAAS
jgi:hypothetical protein